MFGFNTISKCLCHELEHSDATTNWANFGRCFPGDSSKSDSGVKVWNPQLSNSVVSWWNNGVWRWTLEIISGWEPPPILQRWRRWSTISSAFPQFRISRILEQGKIRHLLRWMFVHCSIFANALTECSVYRKHTSKFCTQITGRSSSNVVVVVWCTWSSCDDRDVISFKSRKILFLTTQFRKCARNFRGNTRPEWFL